MEDPFNHIERDLNVVMRDLNITVSGQHFSKWTGKATTGGGSSQEIARDLGTFTG